MTISFHQIVSGFINITYQAVDFLIQRGSDNRLATGKLPNNGDNLKFCDKGRTKKLALLNASNTSSTVTPHFPLSFIPQSVESVKQTWKMVGHGTVLQKINNKNVAITVWKRKAPYHRIEFKTVLSENSECTIGFLKIQLFELHPSGEFGSKAITFSKDDPIKGYGPNNGVQVASSAVKKIYVEWVEGNEKYNRVGTTLMQVAIEYSKHKGCKSKVILEAANYSHGFYYKLGFRSWSTNPEESQKIDAIILDAINQKQRPVLTDLRMYLTPEAIDNTWTKKISKSSIAFRDMSKCSTAKHNDTL